MTSWSAEPWLAGGMAAIMLHDPSDDATRQRVETLLHQLAADPANGIDRVLTGTEAQGRGGFPDAAFLVLFRIGFYTGAAFTGPLLVPTPGHGTHGYSPDDPEMYASFFAEGPTVAHGRDLRSIDMRQIAPTIAHLLGVSLPSAKGAPLALGAETRP